MIKVVVPQREYVCFLGEMKRAKLGRAKYGLPNSGEIPKRQYKTVGQNEAKGTR